MPSTDSSGAFTSNPEHVLDAWMALEVLAPTPFHADQLAREGRLSALEEGALPWAGRPLGNGKAPAVFYEVVLGTVRLPRANRYLLTHFSDSRPEFPDPGTKAMLAVAVVDATGRLVQIPAVCVSSFAWGLAQVLDGNVGSLARWSEAELPLVEDLDEQLRRADLDGLPTALDLPVIAAATEWLIQMLGLPGELVDTTPYGIRRESPAADRSPTPPLLNGFFLRDLQEAKARVRDGSAPANLMRYLGCDDPKRQVDLLSDLAALSAAVAPARVPPGRWPRPGSDALNLLQQAAVNLCMEAPGEARIVAINGPPGTGKTTVLRDLFAGIVTQRAEAMCTFDDPETAFIRTGQRLSVGTHELELSRLHDAVRGFEMVVAASTNKAVENVSAEVPTLDAVRHDSLDLRYFRTLSDALLGGDTWGLASAVLGSSSRQKHFRDTFWWHPDAGMLGYLSEISGRARPVEHSDPDTGETTLRPPTIVTNERPPQNRAEALDRWRAVRSEFQTALDRSRDGLARLEALRGAVAALASHSLELAEAKEQLQRCVEQERAATQLRDVAAAEREVAAADLAQQLARLAAHDRSAPVAFSRVLPTRSARLWRLARVPINAATQDARSASSRATGNLGSVEARRRLAQTRREGAAADCNASAERLAGARGAVDAGRKRLGAQVVDEAFFARDHATRHASVAWLDSEQQLLRDAVFVAAMNLHRAFIDGAARPLRHNLGALMKILGGDRLPTSDQQALEQDLWASLFLVIPLVSTTFASARRMFGTLPAASLGWLFVDEAGQAVPQAAVGMLMRTRRAVVVGDPLQIQPIVTLPDALTNAVCRHFSVDPGRFNAPNASAQSLADRVSEHATRVETSTGTRLVGAPLLVHRRCAEPMFGISNGLAYNGLMVQAKAPRPSPIGDVLGPSAWLDVQGSTSGKWCPEEGERVMKLLRALLAAKVPPDLYIITPFVIVADGLRARIQRERPVVDWLTGGGAELPVGTVHAVQGREVEAVILVLGAPGDDEYRARMWAGQAPNLLNVAVTRAKERLYVVGNRGAWRDAGVFRELDRRFVTISTA